MGTDHGLLQNRFIPQFFDPDFSDGRPKLTEAGKKALLEEAELKGYK